MYSYKYISWFGFSHTKATPMLCSFYFLGLVVFMLRVDVQLARDDRRRERPPVREIETEFKRDSAREGHWVDRLDNFIYSFLYFTVCNISIYFKYFLVHIPNIFL